MALTRSELPTPVCYPSQLTYPLRYPNISPEVKYFNNIILKQKQNSCCSESAAAVVAGVGCQERWFIDTIVSKSGNGESDKHLTTMDSYNHSSTRIVSNDNVRHKCKSLGSFASAFVRHNSCDNRNNNNRGNAFESIFYKEDPSTTMTSNSTTTLHEEDQRVPPINGEVAVEVSKKDEASSSSSVSSTSTKPIACERRQSNSRKDSLLSNSLPKINDIYGHEPWKDDSLSLLSSSFSSSMSSIPSPPSTASPPSYRPQSLPQSTEDVCPEGREDILPGSLPDPSYFIHYSPSKSCPNSPRKRIRDGEGFIRRAACVCVNQDETQVLLVSSKSSREVFLVPGGGLEEGEEPSEAAIREAYEEAGVRGTILSFMGIVESRPEVNNSGKKHRTALFVVRVDKEEDDYPELATLGRQRKWMPLDEALAHLVRHRPRQSVYLQLLRASRLQPARFLSSYENPKMYTSEDIGAFCDTIYKDLSKNLEDIQLDVPKVESVCDTATDSNGSDVQETFLSNEEEASEVESGQSTSSSSETLFSSSKDATEENPYVPVEESHSETENSFSDEKLNNMKTIE